MADTLEQTSFELAELDKQQASIQDQILEMKTYLEEAPVKKQKEEDDRIRTLPAPDEIYEKRREKEFFDRLSRGELKNERRHQTKNGVIMILLLIAITSVCLWISKHLSQVL